MKIFYVEIDKFKEKYGKDLLSQYADKELKTDKRFYEYTIGRYLVKEVAKKYYNICDTEIITNKDGKPLFKTADLHFSISHSKNLVIACFDNYPCGMDIEYIKERDLVKLSKYFKKTFTTKEDFYKYWTLREATYKLCYPAKSNSSFLYDTSYYISISSVADLKDNEINPVKLVL